MPVVNNGLAGIVSTISSRSVAQSTLVDWGRNFLISGPGKHLSSDLRWVTDRRAALDGRVPEDLPTPLDYAVKQVMV